MQVACKDCAIELAGLQMMCKTCNKAPSDIYMRPVDEGIMFPTNEMAD